MGDTTYTLGKYFKAVIWEGIPVLITQDGDEIKLYDCEPHELRKLAQAQEDANRLRDLGEDSNHIA